MNCWDREVYLFSGGLIFVWTATFTSSILIFFNKEFIYVKGSVSFQEGQYIVEVTLVLSFWPYFYKITVTFYLKCVFILLLRVRLSIDNKQWCIQTFPRHTVFLKPLNGCLVISETPPPWWVLRFQIFSVIDVFRY